MRKICRCRYLKSFGQSALMSKLDLSDTFHHILVHPADWELLGSSWPIEIDSSITTAHFVDAYLPFSLPSLPSLFLKFAYSLTDVMYSCGVFPVLHYLDDFWTRGHQAPGPVCLSNLQTMLHTCSDPGFTTNLSKTIGPCTCLELLEIVLDSLVQEARISE